MYIRLNRARYIFEYMSTIYIYIYVCVYLYDGYDQIDAVSATTTTSVICD